MTRLSTRPDRELSQLMVTFEQARSVIDSDMQIMSKKRWKTPNDSEDETNEGNRRMRDLREIGLGMASKQKSSICISTEGSREISLLDSTSRGKVDANNGLSCSSRSKKSCSSLKRRQSGSAQTCKNLRRKYRRRPLAKLCNGTRAIIPSYCLWVGPSEQNTKLNKAVFSADMDDSPDCSGTSSEEVIFDACGKSRNISVNSTHLHPETKDSELSTISEFIDTDSSDHLFNVPLVMGDIFADAEKLYSCCNHDGVNSQYNEGLGESGCIVSATQLNYYKKRKDKRILHKDSVGQRLLRYQASSKDAESESLRYTADRFDSSLNDKVPDRSSVGLLDTTVDGSFDNCSLLIKSKYLSEVGDASVSVLEQSFVNELEEDESAEVVNKLSNLLSCSRKKGVSLSSDLPVSTLTTQELLPFGKVHYLPCTKYQLSKPAKSFSLEDSTFYDVELNVQASYQGSQVPLVSLMSKLNGKAIVGHPVSIEVLEKGFCHPLLLRSEKIGKLQAKVTAAKYSLKKVSLPNRKSGISPRKMRRLSSITLDSRDDEDDRRPVLEKIGGPAFACVPLRVVFSRIDEALRCAVRSGNAS
ncbi:uncharacterized protein At1g51745-like [Ananas comosus]|uniref:Uncharacterized protein At1g51745-like n=1 Tax=Ananas comosus TaxID=4615 RepID=A0A6P5FNQ8_ANACO|nr:uncharacterized protein At1g51745-like [Ananas comosus]